MKFLTTFYGKAGGKEVFPAIHEILPIQLVTGMMIQIDGKFFQISSWRYFLDTKNRTLELRIILVDRVRLPLSTP